MDIQVGDLVTYKNETKFNVLKKVIVNESELDYYQKQFNNKSYELLKIERQNYEVIEEKKELLTEEEKEFLKMISKIRIDGISHIKRRNGELDITGNTRSIVNYIPTNKFKGLNEDEEYTLKELGLE